MNLDVIPYDHLLIKNPLSIEKLQSALLSKGIVGIANVPDFETITREYINTVRQFSALPQAVKQSYAPNRDANETEGYELGAEWFQDQAGNWLIDDKKASFYAFVPDDPRNIWPTEVDLKTIYLKLGELIFATGKVVLNSMNILTKSGIFDENLIGYGRMLHYHKENDNTLLNPNWCGAHLDHGIFTGLVPAYYFQEGIEVDEPEEAGLFIKPHHQEEFEKVNASDKSILLFQAGEFGQLISNDQIQATRHMVKKARGQIERFTFALFLNATGNVIINSSSQLTSDARYAKNQSADGSISYQKWQDASYARYRAQ
jgi:isopenicillin N synthase-like dioxygenase